MAMSERYIGETKDVIQARMDSESRDDIDKRQGSVFYDLTDPMAVELAQAYLALDNVLTFGFASEDMPGEYLDLRASEVGISRRPAVIAQGSVTFFGTDGSIVPLGTSVYTDEEVPIYFVTTEVGTVTNGSVTVTAEAEEGGLSGNVLAGEISLVGGNVSGITSVTNELPFDGGSDEESDEELLNRYYQRVRRPATSGNIYHYEQWALEIAGVGNVRVLPLWNGAGTVKVVILDTEGTSPAQAVVDEVQTYLDPNQNGDGSGVAPIGATVTAVGATEVPINISADITMTENGNIDEITAQVSESVTEYLRSLAFVDPIVRRTQIADKLLDADNVLDYANLTINGGTANIEVAETEVAVLGTVTLNAV